MYSASQPLTSISQSSCTTVSFLQHPPKSCNEILLLFRLFDSPATPKTILEKSSSKFMKFLATNLDVENFEVLAKPIDGSTPLIHPSCHFADKPKAFPLYNKLHENVMANVNPFTPPGMLIRSKKRTRQIDISETQHNSSLPLFLTSTNRATIIQNSNNNVDKFALCYDEELNEFRQAPKRLALQDSNISRYEKEFVELKLLGVGEFGLVYQCLNRLDGCIYAIKRSIKPVAGSAFELVAYFSFKCT